MNEVVQMILVILIVGGAVVWAAVRMVRTFRGKGKGACGSCQLRGKCRKKSCKD